MADKIECDFSKARVGDRCWDMFYGDVTITEIDRTFHTMTLSLSNNSLIRRQVNGKIDFSDEMPSLYWSRPIFDVPPPPKRTKRVMVWVGVNPEKEPYGTRRYMTSIAFGDRETVQKEVCWPVYPLEIEVPDEG